MNVAELDAAKTPEARPELLPNCSTRCSLLPNCSTRYSLLPSCSTKCSRTGKEGKPTWESSPIREPKDDDARAATPWRAADRHHHLPATQATRTPPTDAAGRILTGPCGAQTSSIKPRAAVAAAAGRRCRRGQERPELCAGAATSSLRGSAAASLSWRMLPRRAPRWHPQGAKVLEIRIYWILSRSWFVKKAVAFEGGVESS